MSSLRASAVVFLASFCTLVVEIAAGRVLAPHVGVSLYTWTSIIGVVLAGISAGAWAGGVLADRRPAPSTLGWLLLASGIASLLIAPASTLLAGKEGLLSGMGIASTLLQRVVVLSFLLFFLPAVFLGMISPVAVKLTVRDLGRTGSVVGRLYALSTLGSIAGTFVTGFYLVARFGTKATLIGVGVVLIAAALLLGDLLGRRMRVAALALAICGAAWAGIRPGAQPPPYQAALFEPGESGVIHEEESEYYTIRVERTVRRDSGAPLHSLVLDHLVHSYSDPEDASYLEYGYLRVFRDVAVRVAEKRADFRLLFVGGGGYTLPRLIDETYERGEVDVVEIDPAVTRIAHRFFRLPRQSSIRTMNEDARWFAMSQGAAWDAVFIDAFNDLSVPWHLTTLEYTRSLQERLAPDGVLAANVIDDYARGRFLASYARTLQAVFGEENVAVVMEEADDRRSSRSTFVVIASRSLPEYLGLVFAADQARRAVHGPALRQYVASRGGMVLTDDHAPVDNMLAPLFVDRFVDEQ